MHRKSNAGDSRGDEFLNYTYMLKCSDGTLYTGWTNDLDKRVEAHNSGKGAKYTKARRQFPVFFRHSYHVIIQDPRTGTKNQKQEQLQHPADESMISAWITVPILFSCFLHSWLSLPFLSGIRHP